MSLQDWALPQLSALLPLDEDEIKQVLASIDTLPSSEAAKHLNDLVGESPEALRFTTTYVERRAQLVAGVPKHAVDKKTNGSMQPTHSPPISPEPGMSSDVSKKSLDNADGGGPQFQKGEAPQSSNGKMTDLPPSYANLQGPPILSGTPKRAHSNQVIEAARVRAKDEQQMQQRLQSLQFQYGIYNSEIEPEHDTEYYCGCPIHMYQAQKRNRYPVQEMWSRAVMYPGEKSYNDNPFSSRVFTGNPYTNSVISPYGYNGYNSFNSFSMMSVQRPRPGPHASSIHQTIQINNRLNQQAQISVDGQEPAHSIWQEDALDVALLKVAVGDKKRSAEVSDQKRQSVLAPEEPSVNGSKPSSKMSSFRKSLGLKSSEERAVGKVTKAIGKGQALRHAIEAEEAGRWPDTQWRYLVAVYQEKTGMIEKIANLRARQPIQYLHLLRAGYFEPIPVAWATQASNPLKFSIEASAGWRGLTPQWRGYEDTAEERLYWVLNHREGSVGLRMKPDFISEMNMARARMDKAVEPPPMYYSANDICHVQHTSDGYSKQVMPTPFRAFDRPEVATDDTMLLLDVSGSMNFDPVRPVYEQYLITRYVPSTQPKNKDVAKAIIRRFADAMANHDHQFGGYDLTTFSTEAHYIGTVNHRNLDQMWRHVRIGGGTRVMTGWQQVKERHFQKHSESATHHPVYGWQAGPETPMLRLLLLLDGEATDMDEFELDLLGLSWAHVTIFLIGVDGCPHHHRHANELQRISDVNHHVSFVDAQGNTPERFVTHELLKRHLGYDITMQEFEQMEELPSYTE